MLIITVGPSGSGKSTYRKNSSFKIVCPDDIRKEVTGNISDQSKNNEVWIKAYERLRTYLECEKNVIFDSTACNINTINNLMNIANSFKIYVEFKLFEIDIQTAYNRIQNDLKNGVDRSNVPLEVIKKQIDNFKKVKEYIIEQKFNLI
jgi:predicted kinase